MGFGRLRQKLACLILADMAVIAALYVLKILFVQTLFLLWNVSVIVGIILWERHSAWKEDALNEDLSADQKWGKTKLRIEWVDNRLAKAKTESEAAALRREREWLLTELRRLEWSVKESELSALGQASAGRLDTLNANLQVAGPEVSSIEGKKAAKMFDATVNSAIEVVMNEPEGFVG